MKIINTEKAPKAIGPYSQAIKACNLIFVSGQVPINPLTGKIESKDIKEQTKQCLENLKAIIEEAGSKLEKVIKCTIYVTDLKNFAAVNEIYGSYFSVHKPARVCVEVSKLPLEASIEIDAIAKKC